MVSASLALTIVAVVTAALFAFAGLGKVASVKMSLEQRDALSVTPGLWRTIGVLELLGALGVGGALLGIIPPWLGEAAAGGFILLILGAIATRIREKSPVGMMLMDVVTLVLAVLTLLAVRAL